MGDKAQSASEAGGVAVIERELRMDTPAFLGNAIQRAQWRTPPLKALLRQWWRVREAAAHDYDAKALQKAESQLFGTAGEERNTRQSAVRLRLEHWNFGGLDCFQKSTDRVGHGKQTVDPRLYTGYGPVTNDRKLGAQIATIPVDADGHKKSRYAIGDGSESNTLWLRLPAKYETEIVDTLTLIDWFGAVGNRARNGWGSLAVGEAGARSALTPDHPVLRAVLRPIADCLSATGGRDWPHAIGTDGNGALIWHLRHPSSGRPFRRYEDALKSVTELRKEARQAAGLPKGKRFGDGHLLSYPVTGHEVSAWSRDARLPNQLRVKIVRVDGGYLARVFHMPARLPSKLARALKDAKPDPDRELATWRRVHRILDEMPGAIRLEAEG